MTKLLLSSYQKTFKLIGNTRSSSLLPTNWCLVTRLFRVLTSPVVPSCHGDFSVLKKDKTDTLAVFESETGRQTVDAVFFVVIKYFNLRLHSMFDTQECVEVEDADTENDGDGDVRNKHDLRGNKNGLNRRQNETAGTEEDIELQEMGGQGSENYELEGAAFIDEASRRPSRDDEVVSSGPLDVLEEGGKESKTSEAEQELSAASRNVSNSTSERMATFGTLQNFI